MSTHIARPSTRHRLRDTLTQSFWILDVTILAMLVFFVVLGGVDLTEATTLGAIVATLTILMGINLWRMHRNRAEISRSKDQQMARERRGF